ncbi:MAG: TRAP transporter substrate-binding protein [Pelagibacterales bacterium]|nr:TRAP transporter substrate-binding protein [Pelagibacterales bacterium]
MKKEKSEVTILEKKQSRRKFFKAAAATGAVAATALAMPNISVAQSSVTLKMQSAWGPSDADPFFEMNKQYARKVEAMSGGSLKIEVLPVNAVLKTAEIADGVSTGVVDAGHTVTAYWYGKNPASSLFGTGPSYGFSSQELMGWIEYGGGRALYEKVLAATKLDYVGFFAMPMPAQPFGWFKKELKSKADVAGLKYRTVGLATNVLQGIGLTVLQLPGGEIQPAMKTGLIDAAEFNNPSSDRNFGMQDVSKFYSMGSFHQSQEMFEITINKKRFDSLSPQHKAILRIASEAANTDNYWYALKRYSDDLAKLINESGVKVFATPKDILAEQMKSWDKVIADFSAKDPLFKEIVESQKRYARSVMKYLFLNQPDYQIAYRQYFGNPAAVKV